MCFHFLLSNQLKFYVDVKDMQGLFFISIHIIYTIFTNFCCFILRLIVCPQQAKRKKKTVCVTKFKTHFGKYYRILCIHI